MGRLRNITDSRVGKAGSTVREVMIYSPFGKLLGGTAGHTLYEAGTTQYYDVGSRYVTGDGRIFRYALAGGTLIPGQGVKSYHEQHIAYAVFPAAAAAGTTTLSVTVAAHDGSIATHDGTLVENELVGGYILIFDKTATNMTVFRQILSNTAVASGGGTTVITIDDPIPNALSTSDACECMASPYLSVVNDTDENKAVVGLPSMVATVGQYLWIQTYGPCWIAPHADVGTGANVHEAFFNHDGSLGIHGDGASLQHAGFVMTRARGGGQGAPFIMLQISI